MMEQETETTTTSAEGCPPPSGEVTTSEDNAMEQLSGGGDDDDGADDDKKEEIIIDDAVFVIKKESAQIDESPMFLLSNNGTLCLEFLEDQGREDNFTDLDLICCDGYIQVHRCLLMGASTFLRDLLIGKDIMDTTAITLPDISVRHLRQVLGLLYSGRTLVEERDEVEIFETMKMLGLPVSELMCRGAKNNDVHQIAVLRHVAGDGDDSACSKDVCEDEESQKSVDDDEEPKEDDGDVKTEITTLTPAPAVEKAGDDNVEKTESGKTSLPNDVVHVNGDSEDHLHQITSTTGDSDSVNDFVPSSKEGTFNGKRKSENLQEQLKETLYKVSPTDTIQAVPALEDNDPSSKSDDEGSGKDVIINEESDRNSDVESIIDEQSQSNNASHSVISDDLEDLNFEEACNDLQKQVAKPLPVASPSPAPTNSSSGYEMKLRKRKINDNAEDTKVVTDDKPKPKTGSTGGSKPKKKKATPKKGNKGNVTNGTKAKSNEDDISDADKPIDTRAKRASIEKGKRKSTTDTESVSSAKTGKSESPSQPRRLSTCSSTTDSNAGTAPLARVFLEVKEFSGVKYNIYGFMDPVKGLQSGKTIAIMASKDNPKSIAPRK